VAQVLDLLGVAANLSQCRKNIEYDHIATNDEDITTNEEDIATNEKDIATNKEDIATYEEETVTSVEDIAINEDHIKLEIVFEPISEVETCLREDDFDKATDNSLIEKYVNIEKIVERPYERYRPNKKVAAKTANICNVCEYSAKFASQLEVHMRRHTGEKPFKCTICTFSSYNAYGLKRHIRIHTGEKPYTCRICDSSYSQSSQLRTHSRVHSGENHLSVKYALTLLRIPIILNCTIESTRVKSHTPVKYAISRFPGPFILETMAKFTLGKRIIVCKINCGRCKKTRWFTKKFCVQFKTCPVSIL